MSKEARKADIALRLKVVEEGLWPSCLSCTHWAKLTQYEPSINLHAGESYCSKYCTVPPMETIIVGCIHYEQDIPF